MNFFVCTHLFKKKIKETNNCLFSFCPMNLVDKRDVAGAVPKNTLLIIYFIDKVSNGLPELSGKRR